jgi:hypothetical protein
MQSQPQVALPFARRLWDGHAVEPELLFVAETRPTAPISAHLAP